MPEIQGLLQHVFNNQAYSPALETGPVSHGGSAVGLGRGEAQGSWNGAFDATNNRLRVSVVG